jgi:glycosyltransferase involved in cell wall biosynthesis
MPTSFKELRIGIDATNVGGGGGVTHLIEILKHLNSDGLPKDIKKVVIFSSKRVLDLIPDHPGLLDKVTFKNLNQGIFHRIFFQLFQFDTEIEKRCDVLFSVTGDYIGRFRPVVGMSQNMLLYEREHWGEIKSFKERLRFWFIYQKQKRCFKNSAGIIFLSNYAQKTISKRIDISAKKVKSIPHGISDVFIQPASKQKVIHEYSEDKPFKLLYVSTVHVYKNQWHIIAGVAKLRKSGIPITLDLVGEIIYQPAGARMKQAILEVDPEGVFVKYHGSVDYHRIQEYYKEADAIIFASSCENMPIILVESMASGKPICSSQKDPMPEFLKEGGFFFDEKSSDSIANAIQSMIFSPELREKKVNQNINEIKKYSWEKTSIETFLFIRLLLNDYHNNVQK